MSFTRGAKKRNLSDKTGTQTQAVQTKISLIEQYKTNLEYKEITDLIDQILEVQKNNGIYGSALKQLEESYYQYIKDSLNNKTPNTPFTIAEIKSYFSKILFNLNADAEQKRKEKEDYIDAIANVLATNISEEEKYKMVLEKKDLRTLKKLVEDANIALDVERYLRSKKTNDKLEFLTNFKR